MIRSIILKKIDAFEREIGVSADWLRHVVRHSLRAFFKFMKFGEFGKYRRVLPRDEFFVAQIVAVRAADCGPCVQIAVNVARKSGVAREILQAVIDRKPESLPAPLAEVYRFSEAVALRTGEEDALREALRARLGEEGLIELAFAIASAPVIPTIKRALGHAVSCSRVEIKS